MIQKKRGKLNPTKISTKKKSNEDASTKQATSKESKMKKVFAVHPLTVEAVLEVDDKNFVEMGFSFVPMLEIVAVKINLALVTAQRILKRVLEYC